MKMVSREQWGAKAPKGGIPDIKPRGTTIHWEGPKMGNFPHESCATKVRGIQRFHQDSRGWVDVAYSYLVCPHGYTFEGRGPTNRTAANGTNAGNAAHLAICYLGGQGDPFTAEAAEEIRSLNEWLQAHNGVGPEWKSHRDWKSTECPGAAIHDWVQKGHPGALPTPAQPEPAKPAPKPSKGIPEDGDFGPRTISALQESLNTHGSRLKVDGDFGPATRQNLQSYLNHVNGPVTIDGNIGPKTIRRLQNWLKINEDGMWAQKTTLSLQKALNNGTF